MYTVHVFMYLEFVIVCLLGSNLNKIVCNMFFEYILPIKPIIIEWLHSIWWAPMNPECRNSVCKAHG